jgi:hypothetical protein
MTCPKCGDVMAMTRGAHRYLESGLSDVTLLDVEICECACGERAIVVPHRAELHALIGRTIATDTKFLPIRAVLANHWRLA